MKPKRSNSCLEAVTSGGTAAKRGLLHRCRVLRSIPLPHTANAELFRGRAQEQIARVIDAHGTLQPTREAGEGRRLTDAEQDQRRRGRADIVAELHDRIDAAVADAYGWPDDLNDEEIVERLVALTGFAKQRGFRRPSPGLPLSAPAHSDRPEQLNPTAKPRS